MRPFRRANAVLTGASLALVACLAVYGSWVWRWFKGPIEVPRPAAELAPARPAPTALGEARAAFRAGFLDVRSHLRLSEALYRTGRPVDGFYVMLAARELFGQAFSDAHSLLVVYGGDSYLKDKPFDSSPQAERWVSELLKSAPDDADALDYAAHIAAARGDGAEALRLADQGLAKHPQDKSLLAARAQWTLSLAHDEPGAVAFFERLANAAVDSFEGRQALAELGKFAQRKAESVGSDAAQLARGALQDLYQKYPDNPQVFSALAMAAGGRGEPTIVKGLVDSALSRNHKHAGAAQVAGSLALAGGDVEVAVHWFSVAWEEDPEDLYSAGKLAKLTAEQKADPEAALPYYLALYRKDPAYNDGEPAELRILKTLEARRRALLANVAADALAPQLASQDASIRAEACSKAADSADPRWVADLAGLLDDDTDLVRRSADYALFQIGRRHPEAVLAHRVEWLESPKVLLRVRALNLFADLDKGDTFPATVKALQDPEPAVRAMAKLMVLDHYYKDFPQTPKIAADYLAAEKNPLVLALYKAPEAPAAVAPRRPTPPPKARRRKKAKKPPYSNL